MIIPSEQLTIEQSPVRVSIYHKPTKLQLVSVLTDSNISLRELDSLGNPKTDKQYPENQFWLAVSDFEKRIEEKLGLAEVIGFEVGMIIELGVDKGKYKKGTKLRIVEVNQQGKATKVQPINTQQYQMLERSKMFSKTSKADSLQKIYGKGLSDFSKMEIGKKYNFDLQPNENIKVPASYNLEKFYTGDKVALKKSAGGGTGIIQNFILVTDKKSQTTISANLLLDDGGYATISMTDVKKK